jgi:hypothetical protein
MNHVKLLETGLSKVGFDKLSPPGSSPENHWFVSNQVDEGVSAYLHLVYKPKLKVFTVHSGWKNSFSHAFAVDSIRQMWVPGYDWLTRVKVITAPCMVMFNVADHMNWISGGLDCKKELPEFQSQASALLDGLVSQKVRSLVTPSQLLDCYLHDDHPFHWKNCNSALRIAEIAGLVKLLGVRENEALDRAKEFSALINADMFDLGKGDNWISNLFERIHI